MANIMAILVVAFLGSTIYTVLKFMILAGLDRPIKFSALDFIGLFLFNILFVLVIDNFL